MSTAILDVPADTSFHKNKLMKKLILGGGVKKQVDDLTNNALNRSELASLVLTVLFSRTPMFCENCRPRHL